MEQSLTKNVVNKNLCVGCGACVALDESREARMVYVNDQLIPKFTKNSRVSELAWCACPGKGVDYPSLYQKHYHQLPSDWRVGHVDHVWVGHAKDEGVRRTGSSGGVTSAVLIYLLEKKMIDAAVLVKQGTAEHPENASWFIARTKEEVLSCAQSVYVPVSVLDSLPHLLENETYAMTCVPEQSAALRELQHAGHSAAQRVKYVLGPYTGTSIEKKAIRAMMKNKGIADDDAITSLKWRAGEWPGYLEIITASGKILRSKKVYYNFLIPFFVTQTSLQSMDFANEFTDLSVGDAWSPKYEAMGLGFSVVASRTPAMTQIIQQMVSDGLLEMEQTELLKASEMHGHMIDFKKRGGYIRNRWRNFFTGYASDIGLEPRKMGMSRYIVELCISSVFLVCRTSFARWCMIHTPECILGPAFNTMRKTWKALSKPTKRKGLKELHMSARQPEWKTIH